MIRSDLASLADQIEAVFEAGLPLAQHDREAICAILDGCTRRTRMLEGLPIAGVARKADRRQSAPASRANLARFGGAALCLLFMSVAASAADEPACGPRKDVLAELAKRFQEEPIGIGLSPHSQLVIEVLVAPGGGSWTIISTNAAGRTCIAGTGTDWQSKPQPVVGDPS